MNENDRAVDNVSKLQVDKEYEREVILGPHTVVYPWTVVVVSINAPVADVAVSGSGRSNNLAIGTERRRLVDEHELVKIKTFLLFYNSRILHHGNHTEN